MLRKIFIKNCLFSIFLIFFYINIDVILAEEVGSVTGLPIPRFVMLKSKDINMRSGPGMHYPLKMNFKCISLPVRVISEFEHWRLVNDYQNNEGWIHEAMLENNKYVQIIAKGNIHKVPFMRLPYDKSKQIADIEVGLLAKLIRCQDEWCKISINNINKGWVHKKYLWGINN